MAREGREQDRLADTYVKLLVFVRHMSDWAQSVRLSDRAAESVPSLDLYTEVMAAVTAFGSDAAHNAFEEWMRDSGSRKGAACTGRGGATAQSWRPVAAEVASEDLGPH
jgi:hypothetical protein